MNMNLLSLFFSFIVAVWLFISMGMTHELYDRMDLMESQIHTAHVRLTELEQKGKDEGNR